MLKKIKAFINLQLRIQHEAVKAIETICNFNAMIAKSGQNVPMSKELAINCMRLNVLSKELRSYIDDERK